MYLTRRLDWADLGRPAEAPRAAFQPE
jgi:hypothetical protein